MSAVRDTWVVFSRGISMQVRNPIWLILGMLQPILYLTLFGPLLTHLPLTGDGASGADAWRLFVPGQLVLLGVFGAAPVGFGLVAELRAGVVERMRVTPASRTALLLGRVLRDVVFLVAQGVVLILVALAFGLRAPIAGIVVGLVEVGVLAIAFASLSYAAALHLRREDDLAVLINGLTLPLLLLSGILLPMTLAPNWLRWLSRINPLTHVVEGLRDVFAGSLASSTTLWGYVAVAGLVLTGVVVGTVTFRSRSA